MEYRCDICGSIEPDDQITHLSLYVTGSEGVDVCLACRMVLTAVARGMQAAGTRRELSVAKQERLRGKTVG